MFAVLVTIQLHPGMQDAFMPLVLQNAAISLAKEKDCHQFDVATDPDRANEVFLYELYSDGAGFEDHLKTEHFLSFDAAVTDMIADKQVITYRTVIQ